MLPGTYPFDLLCKVDAEGAKNRAYLLPKPNAGSNGGSPFPPSDVGKKREGLNSEGFVYTLSFSDIDLENAQLGVATSGDWNRYTLYSGIRRIPLESSFLCTHFPP